MKQIAPAPKQSDIDAIEKGMRFMMESQGVDAMIKEYSKALAYQNALNKVTIEIYKEIISEFAKANDRKSNG